MDVAIPKLRSGTYFPEWLLERRRRAEAALTSVVATCYLLGVSTRRMDKLVQSLGITGLSRSQVSVMAKDLDAQVDDFRTRPLDAGPYTFLAADALMMKVREGGRVVKVAVMVATAVNADGYREVLGVQVASAESGAGWLAFFRDLRCPFRPGRGDRGDPARCELAAVQDPLRSEPDERVPEVVHDRHCGGDGGQGQSLGRQDNGSAQTMRAVGMSVMVTNVTSSRSNGHPRGREGTSAQPRALRADTQQDGAVPFSQLWAQPARACASSPMRSFVPRPFRVTPASLA